jgi:hypothetical protein
LRFGAAVASRPVPYQPNENLLLAAAKELRVSLITIMKVAPKRLEDDEDDEKIN